MNEVTELLDAVVRGEMRAAEQLLPLVYDELRRLASRVPPWLAKNLGKPCSQLGPRP